MYTGCSWKRILATDEKGEYTDVCVPTIDRDGHPNMVVSKEDARLMVAAPAMLKALKAVWKAESTPPELWAMITGVIEQASIKESIT